MKYTLFCLIVLICLLSKANSQEAERYSLSGIITEAKSGESIIGASVSVYNDSNSTNLKPISGAITNKFGFYSVPKLKKGSYYLVIKSIGYEQYKSVVYIDTDFKLNIKLKDKETETEEVIVTAERMSNAISRISTVDIKPDFVFKMPSLGGESDVFRTLQLLPGIKQGTELSSGLYIRGGSPDQNLILLDGVIVYNPTHLGGFLSSFNTDAIKDIRLIKGAFPAEYGGRLSSVLDMNMKEGNTEEFHGAGGISLIASRLTLEGPISDNCSFMISGRRMYLDLLLGLLPDSEDAPNYYFYDLNAKINYRISDNDRLFVSGMFCRDVLDSPDSEEDDFSIYWGNKTANIRWMHISSPTVFTNFSLIYTSYDFNIDLADNNEDIRSWKSKSEIQDVVLRGDLTYYPADNHTLKSGIDLTFHNFDVSAYAFFEALSVDEALPDRVIRTFDASVYFQDEWKINDKITTNLGARFYYFQEGNYFNIEPRISMSYIIGENTTLNFSTALANQYLHMVTRGDIPLPTDVWYPSTENIKPAQSWQTVVGFEKVFADGEYLFSVEAYYKGMKNLLEYKDNANFSIGIPIDSQFTSGTGKAYGIEFFLNKRMGDLTGWIGYTLSSTKRKFAELNNGKEFFPRYDRTHDIAIALNYKIGSDWELGATWTYGTGQAYTMPSACYGFSDIELEGSGYLYDKYYVSGKNEFRLPAFHKLDLNFMFKFEMFELPFELSVNIYNAYNHKNPFFWYIDSYSDNTYKKTIKQITLFPIIPTLGLSFKF